MSLNNFVTASVRFTETYPNLAWIFSLMLTEPIFWYLGYGMRENKVIFELPKILWLTIVEELLFRKFFWQPFVSIQGKHIALSSVLIGLHYSVASGNLIAFRYFGLLGLTYGFASRKYSSAELMIYRAGLYAGLCMVVR
jgi:membrane protease YdiL (CAAX protease family)